VPGQVYDFAEPLSAFFWERRPSHEPTLQRVVKLCTELGISSLHLHAAPDFRQGSGQRLTRPEMFVMDGIQVTTSTWFEDRSHLDRVAERAHVFFAPRALEGIGMSFLEAMARGQIVVAPDKPTMNEYIRHRTSGILYDFSNLGVDCSLTPESMARMSRAALRKTTIGYEQWKLDGERFKSFVVNDGRRWSTKDSSSHFRNEIRRRASKRAREQ
jgi:glycosyltransferase involved in cell wall biosynthesis